MENATKLVLENDIISLEGMLAQRRRRLHELYPTTETIDDEKNTIDSLKVTIDDQKNTIDSLKVTIDLLKKMCKTIIEHVAPEQCGVGTDSAHAAKI
jgi:predicted RNase H-like nuclease (RuvC/YqgF family)